MVAAALNGMATPRDARSRDIKPPSRFWLLTEGRGVLELGWFAAARPWLKATLPKGEGQPVLVLPGLGASDLSTRPMRGLLKDLGYGAHGWKLSRNLGLRENLFEDMEARINELYERYGQKVSLVGWSLGGLYARELAKVMPEKIRQVITLGSPFSPSVDSSHARRVYEWASGQKVNANEELFAGLPTPPPVPTTSIYSRTDGIVHWQASRNAPGKQVENIEVPGSHIGLGHNPVALYALFDRLSQKDGAWTPFERNGLRAAVFKNPDR